MNYVRSNRIKLKYQRILPSGCKDIGIKKVEFVRKKTQFLFLEKSIHTTSSYFAQSEFKFAKIWQTRLKCKGLVEEDWWTRMDLMGHGRVGWRVKVLLRVLFCKHNWKYDLFFENKSRYSPKWKQFPWSMMETLTESLPQTQCFESLYLCNLME